MLRKPNLKVIDKAIEFIEKGAKHSDTWKRRSSKYSCCAIMNAGLAVHPTADDCYDTYLSQYRMFVKSQNKGRLPGWWDNLGAPRHHRISALKAFKKACIKAGKKQAKQ